MKKAFITGINGQDGSYLAELLLEKGYEVYGLVRRASQPIDRHIEHIKQNINLCPGDMCDAGSLHDVIKKVKPDEIYNLAAMSQVRWSFQIPAYTMDVNCTGFLRLIEAVRQSDLDCKIYQASSSEMFGKVVETPQKETTPFYPRSPYGVAKVAAHYMARVYREAYKMKIYAGILFNHESPRRGEEFLTRIVSMGVANIIKGRQKKIAIGNLEAKRDFGYAKEYVEWIWNIVQHHTPDEFIIGTGETHSVREFIIEAFKVVGIENWQDYIEHDPSKARPAEVDLLMANPEKSRRVLGFEAKVKFTELVKIMVDAELSR